MFINIFESIKIFIKNLFAKFDLSTFTVLFFGILIGFILCMGIYLVIVFASLKKSRKVEPIDLDEIDNIRIRRIIENAKQEYEEQTITYSSGEKLMTVRDLSWQIINDIAKIYYPDSNHPVYELSIEEMITLNEYILVRIEELFSGRVLGVFKRVKVSQIIRLLEFKKRMEEKKAVKLLNQTKTPFKSVMAVLNVFNPVYWVRRLMLSTSIDATLNRIAKIVLDVVGVETNRIYGRSTTVFGTDDDEIASQISEIETILQSEK